MAIETLQGVLRKGYATFRSRRIIEAILLGAAVTLPALLGALVLGILLGPGRLSAWLVPVAAAAGLLGGMVRAASYAVRSHLGFGEFLVRVEERARLGRNELLNALQLGRRIPLMEDPLAREVASEVLRRGTETARAVPFASLAPARNLRTPTGQAAGALVGIALLSLLAPQAMVRSAGQIVRPGHVDPATAGMIVVAPGDATLERGASLEVNARLIGLDGEPILFHRVGDGAWQREAMRSDSGGFSGVLADLQATTEYAVAVRETRSPTYRVLLTEPLRATGYEKRIEYPAYTGLAPEKELSPHGSITALVGSEVDLMVAVSRSDARARLVFESGREVALQESGEMGRRAKLRIREPERYHVELSGGARSAGWRSDEFHIEPIPDRHPSLYLIAPGEQVDLPPDMRVLLEVDCADDFGLTRLALSFARNDAAPQRAEIARLGGEREARVSHPWDLSEIAMVPGDRIRYRLELTDNDAVSGPKTTVSPEFVIRFPTLEEMYVEQTEERREGIESVRESLERQADLREQLDRISRELRTERSMEWEQKQEVESFLEKQEQILERMENLASAMDRQMQRMEQGQLFSPEIVSKIAQIQDLMRQIQSPEFHRMMEQMRQAMERLDPEAVRKAMEQMKLTQKQLEQGLDRTLEMLERLLAEQKLDEMIQRGERLAAEQERINEELNKSPSGSKGDSTSALSPEQAKSLAERQQAAQKELEELRRQMEELKKLASESHEQMSEKLEGSQGEQSEQSLQESSEAMESGKQCMSSSNRSGARKAGSKASKGLQSFLDRMRQMQSQIEQSMTAEMSKKLLGLAGDLVELSQRQESLIDRAAKENNRDLAVEQDRIGRATGAVVDQIYELARQTPFITPGQMRMLGEIQENIASATDSYETGHRPNAGALGKRAGSSMDAVVASLLESNQSMCNASSSSSSCNRPNPFSQMEGLTGQQQGVNQQSQQLQSQMQGGRLPQDGGGRLEQLAARQQQIRQGLMDLSQSMGEQQGTLGRLDDLAKEMEEVAKEMRDRRLDDRLLRRQEKILSRLLTAQRSLRRQDFEEQRRSRTGVDPVARVSPPPVDMELPAREQLRRGILKGSQDPIPSDFRSLVDRYFRALMEQQ